MVFKRRDRQPILTAIGRFIWPRGGWRRAFEYVKIRLRRLPDTPEKISRGIWAGVFVTFSPLYGLHFLIAALIAKVMRGNIIASLLATFFGNPLTYLPIAIVSLETGYFLVGGRPEDGVARGLGLRFSEAWADLRRNFMAMFTQERADWHGLIRFYDEVFFPYLIGGILPGIIAATAMYLLCRPLIAAYQNRRKEKLRAKLRQLRNPEDDNVS